MCVGRACPPDTLDTYRSLKNISTGTFWGGLGALIVGVALIAVDASEDEPGAATLGIGPGSIEIRGRY